jgi:diguanylate cyclase (GGDEF)-like protein
LWLHGLFEEEPVRLSIAARVSIACTTVIVLGVGLLLAGFAVSQTIYAADQRIASLSEALHSQDQHDRAQQRLRLNIGDATRAIERGETVSGARWRMLAREARAFAATPVTFPAAEQHREAALIAQTCDAADEFAAVALQIVATARTRPALIDAVMPRFVAALKRLEASRGRTREALTLAIMSAAEKNGRESQRSIVAVLFGGFVILLIIAAMSAWLRRHLVTPITLIARRLHDFRAAGGDGEVPGTRRRDELGDLARGLAEYRGVVESRRAAERRADFLAHHDMLTGLANRLLFENRLAHELMRSARTGDTVAVLAIDLDGFKEINDRYGHAGGDRALKRAGAMLSRCVRGDDLVARVGGDEFAIVQAAQSQPAAAEALLARIYKEAQAADTVEDAPAIRLSAGVALSEPGQRGDELYELADTALFRAKADGRHTARFFNKDLREQESLRLRLARDLEHAVEADQLYLVFQPIADAGTLRVTGYEALLRWRHPVLGEIGPDTFIPIAESSGLIAPIGAWVIDHALAAAAGWPETLSLAINLSPLQFRAGGLADDLRRVAQARGVALTRLELEVTESATLLGYQRDEVLATLKALQTEGARVVMDDFGTGHSSLSNLKDFAFNKIKIDRSFIAAMGDHPPSASIVRAIIGLGKSLKLTIVAEGVETEAQLTQLRRWGCDQVQGYLIGRPAREILSGAEQARINA